MKNIFCLSLIIFSINSFGNTDLLFESLYDGLKHRKLLLRHEIQNIHKRYENNLNKSNQNFVLNRLKSILRATDSISTTKVKKQYIKNNITKLMRSIEFDINNTKLTLPKKNLPPKTKNNKLFNNSTSLAKLMKAKSVPNEIQSISVKQSSLKSSPRDLNSPNTSRHKKTSLDEYLIYFTVLCLMFIAGRKSRNFNRTQVLGPTTPSNNQSKITLTKLLSFLNNNFKSPVLICDSKQQVKWSNSYCEKELDIQTNDIFDFNMESFVLGAHRYLKCSDTYYLAQSKKIRNKTLYFFIPLEIGPNLAASNLTASINSFDKNVDNLGKLIQHFKDELQTHNTSLEFTTNINKENQCCPKHLNIIHSFLDSLLETIESESKSNVSIKLDIVQSKSRLNLDFDVSNISSNALRFAFSVNQKKLEDLNLSCTFFNGEKGINARVLYRSNYLNGIPGVA